LRTHHSPFFAGSFLVLHGAKHMSELCVIVVRVLHRFYERCGDTIRTFTLRRQ
jgi:hypothetical protein